MQDIISKVHVHMPFHLFPEYKEMILQNRLNLEIYFHHWALQSMDKKRCRETAKIVADAGLKINFHAPFMDLRPGAFDDKIRQASIDRIKQALDLASYFHPLKIVCHASFDEDYYVNSDDLWLDYSVKTWKKLAALAKDNNTVIALENIWDTCICMTTSDAPMSIYLWDRELFHLMNFLNICARESQDRLLHWRPTIRMPSGNR